MNRKNKITLGRRKPLVKKLLLIEGIGRAGKFLAANIINGFADVEPVQLCGLLEHIPFFTKLGFIEKRAAEELLHHEIDMHCYEMLIGRNLNHRPFDKSSIFNNPDYKKLLSRSKEPDSDKELKSFYKRGAYSFFLLHEVLPYIRIYFNTFPKMKIISLRRSPADLVYSWYSRRVIGQLGTNPKFFRIPLQGSKGPIPWYHYQNPEEYESLNAMDRVIAAMENLFDKYEKAEKSFSANEKKKILFLRYEDFLERTTDVIKTIQKFLGKKPVKGMRQILKREKLPNPNLSKAKKAERLIEIKAKASPRYFKKLLALEDKYFNNAD